jgi:uncharacterized protein DUF4154
VALLNTGLAIRFGLILLAGALPAASACAQSLDEYRVKAAFLYNFAKFVEWPPGAFRSPTDRIAICVLGQDPFDGALEDAVKGKTLEGRPFVVAKISEVNPTERCQIVFIAASERKRVPSILADLRGSSALTVGETGDFAVKGGIVNFKIEDGHVRLEINVEAAGQAKLHISSKLLSLAQIVRK